VPDYVFRCAECGATILVDEDVRGMLATDGCAVCGTQPDDGAFSPAEPDVE